MTEIVITLVHTHEAPVEAGQLVTEIREHLPGTPQAVIQTGPDAVDILCDGSIQEMAEIQAGIRASLGTDFDVCVQSEAGRRKRLLLCDMDSTIIQQECIDELADYAGIKDRIAAITDRAMRGELDFEAALTERVGLLKGLPVSSLQACFDDRIRLTPGARTLVQTMKAHGAVAELVSGGFTFFTSRVAAQAGFDANFANSLEDDGQVLTGDVARPILGRQAKLDRLDASLNRLGLTRADAIAIGDGANDSAMIEAAGLGLGFRPHPVLAGVADAVITGPSLTAALYYQGYARSDWVTG